MVYLRRWSESRNAWTEDAEAAAKGGKYVLKSLPKGLGSPAVVSPPASPDPKVRERRVARVEDKYRRLLLETCDIISLVGLPEDRQIAQRQLALRSLYIPLHAWVEASPGGPATDEAPDDPDAEAARWEALEKRRAAARRGLGDEQVERERKRVPVGERLSRSHRLVILGRYKDI